jgi:hypothetical protein
MPGPIREGADVISLFQRAFLFTVLYQSKQWDSQTQLVRWYKLILVKRHVSAYLEAIFRFTKCWLIESNIGTVWLDVEISSSAH